ncbi:MAG: hypothetical protein ACOX6T_11455 [Myxococcales bacterium]|jgi:hypothetical protein
MKRAASSILACLLTWAAPAGGAEPAPATGKSDEIASDADAGAGLAAESVAPPEKGAEGAGKPVVADLCGQLEQRLARRFEWLRARRQEQFELGGPPDPAKGILSAIALWCQEHREDEDCKLDGVTIELRPEELAWSPEKTPEDYDAHVILMKRELNQCRKKQARGR